MMRRSRILPLTFTAMLLLGVLLTSAPGGAEVEAYGRLTPATGSLGRDSLEVIVVQFPRPGLVKARDICTVYSGQEPICEVMVHTVHGTRSEVFLHRWLSTNVRSSDRRRLVVVPTRHAEVPSWTPSMSQDIPGPPGTIPVVYRVDGVSQGNVVLFWRDEAGKLWTFEDVSLPWEMKIWVKPGATLQVSLTTHSKQGLAFAMASVWVNGSLLKSTDSGTYSREATATITETAR